MAVAAFSTDSKNPLDNKVDPDAPNPQPIAPNQVPVAANGDPSSSNPTQASDQLTTSSTGEASTSSSDAQSPTGAGPAASGGAPVPPPISNIPGPGSAPATSAGAAGPGSQPATVPAPQAPAPTGSGPSTVTTAGANGESYVTQAEGTSLTASAPDNSRFTQTGVSGLDRDKSTDKETGGKVYNPGTAESNIHRDANGNIATNENLTPETYKAKTSARGNSDNGSWIVDYTKFGPDGRPMSPAEDAEGWNKLTPEQQQAAMRDYLSNVDEYEKKNGPTQAEGGLDAEFFNPETWATLDDDARKAAVQAWLDGKKVENDAAAAKKLDTPKIVTNADGSVTMASWVDSKGNPISPYSDPAFKNLTREQQTSLMEQFAANAETVANGGKIGEDQDFMGTGMAESAFKNMSPKDQTWMFQNPGFLPPEHHADNSTTYREKPAEGATDGHSYTLDKDGFKTSEYYPAGTFTDQPVTFTYGKDGVSGTTTIGNRVTTRDSQGNDVTVDGDTGWVTTSKDGAQIISAKPDTPAAASIAVGYGPSGERLTLAQSEAARQGIPESELTDAVRESLSAGATKASQSPEGYAYGKTIGTLALEAGLITQEEFDNVDKRRDSGHSWGAWAVANRDVIGALTATGLTDEQIRAMSADSYFQLPRNFRMTDFSEGDMLESSTYYRPSGQTSSDALAGVNLSTISDPQKMYDQAFSQLRPSSSFKDVVRPTLQGLLEDSSLSPEARDHLINEVVQRLGMSPGDEYSEASMDALLHTGNLSLQQQAQIMAALKNYGGWNFD